MKLEFADIKALAEQGHADAQYSLGLMYKMGQSVSQDSHKAVEWYTKAAEQGHSDAQYNLGEMYKLGDDVPQDSTKAIEWYTKAAEQGNSKALEWFKRMNQRKVQQQIREQYDLGVMYEKGQEVRQDYTKAFERYAEAAEQGYGNAQYHLAVMYEKGRGIAQDMTKAFE